MFGCMLSVIIPACNEENYLKETIESVKKQNLKSCEIIVISDGSLDKTDKISAEYADKFLRLEKRQGPAAAKNAGARIARGEILVFLDADTHMTERVLEEIEKVCKNNVVGTCQISPSKNSFKNKMFMTLKNHLLCPLGVSNGILFCTKKTFDEYGGYNPLLKKREEGDFLRKIKSSGNFIILKNKVISSTRRFDQLGYSKVISYWIGEALKPSDKDYPLIR